MSVSRETDDDSTTRTTAKLVHVDPREAAIKAFHDTPIQRRTPDRLLGVLESAGLRLDWAPHPTPAADGRRPWVECAMCGQFGEFFWRAMRPYIVHPPSACALPLRVKASRRTRWVR